VPFFAVSCVPYAQVHWRQRLMKFLP